MKELELLKLGINSIVACLVSEDYRRACFEAGRCETRINYILDALNQIEDEEEEEEEEEASEELIKKKK